MSIKLKTMWWIFAATILVAVGVANASPPPRLGPPECTRYTVVSGDTSWAVAQKNNIPWDQFVQLNGYIENLAQIWPADELTLSCAAKAVAPPPPVVVVAIIPTTAPPTAPVAKAAPQVTAPPTTIAAPAAVSSASQEAVAFECNDIPGKTRPDNSQLCISPAKTLVGFLRQAGFEGDGLVIMTAICLAESAGDPYVHGDTALSNDVWGDSLGWCQIRSVKKQTGTGGPRDAEALNDPQHQADSAWRISSGGTNFEPWTEFKDGNYKRQLSTAEKAVK